jgi:hypothetical protein
VDERGDVVIDLDPPVPTRWVGTVSAVPDPDTAPVPLPTDGLLSLRLPDGSKAQAEVEAIEWTREETLILAVVGQGPAPF